MPRPVGWRLRASAAAAVVGLLGACVSAPERPAAPAPAPPPDIAAQAAPAFSSLVASRSASVVDVSTLRIGRDARPEGAELEFAPENDFADRLARPRPASVRISQIRDLASGLIFTSDGLILTSAHVLAAIDEAQVRLDDGRRFQARVVGTDRRTDVGLLKIDAKGLATAAIGDSSRLAPGDWVAAIGAPFGFHGSVTAGVVSAVDRYIGGAGEVPFIQTDVAINPGSSGSPLFNSRGEVVGINSMIYSGSGGYMGLSFAVPINLAMKIATQLKDTGRVRRAHLGAELQEMTPALAQSFGLKESIGALVVQVDADGPARAAGLVRGDVVTAFDGRTISHFTTLLQQIVDAPPGRRVRVELWRHGAKRAVSVTLSEDVGPRLAAQAGSPPDWNDGLGLSLGELSAAQRLHLGSDGGLMVREATGLARSEGIRAGDIIVAVNDTRLDRIEDFRIKLAATAPGRMVALLVLRDRRLAYVPVLNAP
ncbi:trypsin-like peptidase domain-containing protein [Variovorax sp. J22P271]|uniref:trypsin-like peptidase domain-containing protein n=1 Tax=Variovorax davisae TaxID=3053515 RepID=UPI002576FE03|nr:trypsin-like peptidase domain-containing protein [Variovorax sp. J22P271]MDM0036917.1 trypsin-like peptidase domain-containing protein [Variovorax sp. J22P271]